MNKAREFLHNHPMLERKYTLASSFGEHVIVDKPDWEAVVGHTLGQPSLFIRFHKWMKENDTEENAEIWANYEDEDMFRAFLIDQKLAL